MRFNQVWNGRNCDKNPTEWFPVSVPGNIQYDYGVFHNFEDLNYSDNYKQFLPLEDDHWEYQAILHYDRKDGERVFFVSGGVDYRYDVIINGEKIYSYEGMFRGFELDLTENLNGKKDILTVHIYPHPKSTGGRPNTRDEVDQSCKPPLSYGWDFNPRLLNSGMWEEAYIETRGVSYIGDVEVLSHLSDDLTTGTVTFDFSCELPCKTSLYDMDGNPVYEGTDRRVTVANPNLWWCNGQGVPYLYRWEIQNENESKSGTLGFRTLRLVHNKRPRLSSFPKGRYDAPITVELNGRRIFAKGTNWVAPALFWGHLDEAIYEEHVRLAYEANMNMFRMHAGSGRPKRYFYDLCDRYGILLWQEFPLACNNYRATPHYLGVLESEATSMIRDFRHHPCLAFWCGGNELFNDWSGMDEQSHALRLLNKLCYEMDFERPFLYTSPLIGMAHGGYTFYADHQGGEILQSFQKSNNTAYPEFGIPSITDAKLLRKVIPEEEITFPIPYTKSWITHHGFDAWGRERWLCQDVLAHYFPRATSLEEMVEQSEWLQAEGYRGLFEEMRRQWPYCSMALNWCFNEPWTTVGNNTLLAFPSHPKPSYYTVKSALRPTLFSAKIEKFVWIAGETLEAELWFLNDAPAAAEGRVRVTVTVGDETVELLEWSAKAAANSNLQGPTVRYKMPKNILTDRLTLTLHAENGMENQYVYQYRPTKKIVNLRANNGVE